MAELRWKPILGRAIDGTPQVDPPLDFNRDPVSQLRRILSMPKGKPISLELASELFWEQNFEIWETLEGDPRINSLVTLTRKGIVGYAQELGYQIQLRGDEYELVG